MCFLTSSNWWRGNFRYGCLTGMSSVVGIECTTSSVYPRSRSLRVKTSSKGSSLSPNNSFCLFVPSVSSRRSCSHFGWGRSDDLEEGSQELILLTEILPSLREIWNWSVDMYFSTVTSWSKPTGVPVRRVIPISPRLAILTSVVPWRTRVQVGTTKTLLGKCLTLAKGSISTDCALLPKPCPVTVTEQVVFGGI